MATGQLAMSSPALPLPAMETPALACFLVVHGTPAKGRWKCEAVAASSPRT